MRKIPVLALFFLMYLNCWSQQPANTDSLFKSIENKKDDSAKISFVLGMSDEYSGHDPATAMRLSKEALEISRRIRNTRGELMALKSMAEINIRFSNYDSTLLLYNMALSTARKLGDSLQVGIVLFNIGTTYRYINDLKSAVDYSLQAISHLEATGDKSITGQMYNGLQLIYYYLPDFDKAIFYGNKAVNIARELKNDDLLIMSLSNLSMPYKDKKKLDSAKALLFEANDLATKLNDDYSLSGILPNLASVAIEEKNYADAKLYGRRSLVVNEKIASAEGICISLRALSTAHLQTKNYDSAMFYGKKALAIASENDFKYEKSNCLKTLSYISYAMGDVEEGTRYYNESDDIYEALFREENRASAARYEKLYETEKKDGQIRLQEATIARNRIYNGVLAGSIITISIISLLSYRNYRNRQKLQQQRIYELETEKQLAATEAVLKGEEQERSRLAKDLHDGLGGMLSGIKYNLNNMKGNLVMTPENMQSFERSIDMLDSSIQEMRRVAHNMMPEALVKFGLDTALQDFCNDINKSGALKVRYQSIGMNDAPLSQIKSVTVYRIVQELLNNSIKHSGASNAIVQLSMHDQRLTVTVEDDGKGFDASQLERPAGMGWSNIRNRVEFLKGKWDIDSQPGKGTSVNIEIES